MRDLKPLPLVLAMTLLSPGFVTASKATGHSFEECQTRAVSNGVGIRHTSNKVEQKYLLYKTAGTAKNPKGLIARCLAGLD
jgi:hypothetical protein